MLLAQRASPQPVVSPKEGRPTIVNDFTRTSRHEWVPLTHTTPQEGGAVILVSKRARVFATNNPSPQRILFDP